jgi:hypothetical protein
MSGQGRDGSVASTSISSTEILREGAAGDETLSLAGMARGKWGRRGRKMGCHNSTLKSHF